MEGLDGYFDRLLARKEREDDRNDAWFSAFEREQERALEELKGSPAFAAGEIEDEAYDFIDRQLIELALAGKYEEAGKLLADRCNAVLPEKAKSIAESRMEDYA